MERDPPLPPAMWSTPTKEGADYVASMPMTVDQAIDVFELVANLMAQEFPEPVIERGDFATVRKICSWNGAKADAVVGWLTDQGATSDADIYKAEERFDQLVELDDDAWEAEVKRQISAGELPKDYERYLSSP